MAYLIHLTGGSGCKSLREQARETEKEIHRHHHEKALHAGLGADILERGTDDYASYRWLYVESVLDYVLGIAISRICS